MSSIFMFTRVINDAVGNTRVQAATVYADDPLTAAQTLAANLAALQLDSTQFEPAFSPTPEWQTSEIALVAPMVVTLAVTQ